MSDQHPAIEHGETDMQWKYVCRGCQTEETTDAMGNPITKAVDKVRDGINTKGTAETLAQVHAALNNGHDPEVMPDD